MRVVVLTNILPPYRVGFYNALAARCDLHVVFDAIGTPDRQWRGMESDVRFAYTVAGGWRAATARPGVGYGTERRFVEASNRTLPLLRRLAPDVVVSLELGARTMQAAAYARLAGVPIVCYWEGTPHTESNIDRARRWLRPLLARRMDAFWVNGIESSSYVRSLGARGTLYPDMTGVNTAFFRREALRLRGERNALREALGLVGPTLVTSGSLSDRKGIVQYLDALSTLLERDLFAQFSLLFVGDGEHRKTVERWARGHTRVKVAISGFVQLEALPRYYACADWFVLPTLEDCWPLAPLEALASGLPQVFSPRSGATADLARYAGAGLVADPADREAFAATLARIVGTDAHARPADETIDAVVRRYGPEAQAERAAASLRAIKAARERGPQADASTAP